MQVDYTALEVQEVQKERLVQWGPTMSLLVDLLMAFNCKTLLGHRFQI